MPTSEKPLDWHLRFEQQARWTQDLRAFLYDRAGLNRARRVLDVGCGTGVLIDEMEERCEADIYGLDIARSHLIIAIRNSRRSVFIQGDAHSIPHASHSFDLAYCHFLLLWVKNPLEVVGEMVRVVRPGGVVLALAEPDYGGRIDYPSDLVELGEAQRTSLQIQGADPLIGRKLSGFFHQTGLTSVETGVIGGQWVSPPSPNEWEAEWRVMEHDLQQTSGRIHSPEALKKLDWAAWQAGQRVLFVPTFYAFGLVPT